MTYQQFEYVNMFFFDRFFHQLKHFCSDRHEVLPAEESNKAISDCETAAAPRLQLMMVFGYPLGKLLAT
jgi:hypothetical protein